MPTNGTRYATANEVLRRAWRESIVARHREIEGELERVKRQLEEVRDVLKQLTDEESEGEIE